MIIQDILFKLFNATCIEAHALLEFGAILIDIVGPLPQDLQLIFECPDSIAYLIEQFLSF